ncbi:MAG: response regulator, partial [Myxococcota bacterium]
MTSVRRRRVLLAEDSELFAEVLRDLIEADDRLEVCGVARDGREAVRLVASLKPDIVVMDVLMPVMDGLAATSAIMEHHPTPILILSSDPRQRTGQLSMMALERGALDVLPKPDHALLRREQQAGLLARVRLLSTMPVSPRPAVEEAELARP